MSLTPPAPYQRVVANRPEAHVDFVQDLPLSTLPGLIIWTFNYPYEGPLGTHGGMSAVVQLSAPAPAGGVTLSYRTVDGTARAGSDYTAVSGTLEIPEGETIAYTADIIFNGDNTREGNENFYVVVSDVVGANPVVTRVEIILYEPAPRVSTPLPPVRKR
ncbi:MAG: Calx-beta domain-containing protein, partial [Achromobacter pestifer]